MKFTYDDLQKMQREAPIKNGVLTFDETTRNIQFLSITDNEELKEIRFMLPQPNLRYLDFGRCYINKAVFSKECEKLEAIYLEGNLLTTFAIDIDLPSLILLDLSKNKRLTTLNINVDLPNLKYLYVTACNLTDVSVFSSRFTSEGFDFNILENKNLQTPPPEIVSQGKEAVIRYFQSYLVENKEVKIILLGNTTAGKTSLVEYLSRKNYPPKRTTHGVFTFYWKPNDRDFTAMIWDFGGQEYYHATHRLFLTNNSIYLIIWEEDKNLTKLLDTEITIKEHCKEKKELQHFHYLYWIKLIRNLFAPDSPIIIIQNKTDLSAPVNIDQLCKETYKIEGEYHISVEKAAFEPQSIFYDEFVLFEKKLKDRIAVFIKSNAPKGAGAGMIQRYIVNIRSFTRESTDNYLRFEDFKRKSVSVAKKGGDRIDDFDLEITTKYLRDTGSLLYYGYNTTIVDSILKDYVFIKPNYVTETIYKILDENIQQNGGKFDFEHVRQSVTNENEAILFLELMQSPNFELVFKNEGFYYASQFLPARNEVIEYQKDELEFAFAMRFPRFFSLGFISRFIARYGHDAVKGHFCKTAILLKRYSEQKSDDLGKPSYVHFLISADINEEQITVFTTSEGKKQRFIRKIYDTFLEFADGDQNIEIKLNPDLPPASLSNIALYNLREYDIERLNQPLVYEKNINGNRIKVEGNGNIILQDIKGATITLNLNDFENFKEKLSEEHQIIVTELKQIKQRIPAIDIQEKLFEIMEQIKTISGVGDFLKEMEKRLSARIDNTDSYLKNMHLMLKSKYIDTERIEEIISKINQENEKTVIEVGQNIMEHINWAFEEYGKDYDASLHEIFDELKKTDDIETKIKLSVPLLNLIGIDLSTELKLNKFIKWLESKY